MVSPARRRTRVEHVVRERGVSERQACRVLGQHRSTQRKAPRGAEHEVSLTAGIVELAQRHLHRHRGAADQYHLVAPVELLRLARREDQRHEGSGRHCAACGEVERSA
jgi:hypothetical protein